MPARPNERMSTRLVNRTGAPHRYVHRTEWRRHRGTGCVLEGRIRSTGSGAAIPPEPRRAQPSDMCKPRHAFCPGDLWPPLGDSPRRVPAIPPVDRVGYKPRARRLGARKHDHPDPAPGICARRPNGLGNSHCSRPGGRTTISVARGPIRWQVRTRSPSGGHQVPNAHDNRRSPFDKPSFVPRPTRSTHEPAGHRAGGRTVA